METRRQVGSPRRTPKMTDNLLQKFFHLFQGVETLFMDDPKVAIARIGLMLLGVALIYLGKKGILEPLLMIPMGFGMIAVNAGVLLLNEKLATLFVDPLITEPSQLINILQVDFLQPIYTFAFSNGLIACFVFMGIGVLLDVGYVMQRPFESMLIALFAELGTVATLPIAVAMGLTVQEAAAIAMVGGADGPMVLYTSLALAPKLFVPITVVAYLYLGLTYGGYPYLIKLLVPKQLRGIPCKAEKLPDISSDAKLAFAVVSCILLCLLFPVAAPLFLSLFLGVTVRESGIKVFQDFLSGPLLYGSTFFLGLLLGVLCEAKTIMDPQILTLLILGILALLLSGIGGIIGGYVMYYATGGRYNPIVGIAGVSCVPTTAKVAQKVVSAENPRTLILPQALGACICGVITSAIFCGVYVTLLK